MGEKRTAPRQARSPAVGAGAPRPRRWRAGASPGAPPASGPRQGRCARRAARRSRESDIKGRASTQSAWEVLHMRGFPKAVLVLALLLGGSALAQETFRIAIGVDADSLDPVQGTTTTIDNIVDYMAQTLIGIDENGALVPV